MYNERNFEKKVADFGINSMSLNKYKNHINSKFINHTTPYIPEKSETNIAIMDVFSRMMMDRVIFLGDVIDDYVSNVVTAQLLFLSAENAEEDIKLYVNSPGGSVYDGNSILDVMDFVDCDVATICTGMAASMGAMILSNGTKGKRHCLKRSRVMIHQPLGGVSGQATDIINEAEQIKIVKQELIQTLAENCGQTFEKVEKDCDRDYWMRSQEALEYGIVDKIITK